MAAGLVGAVAALALATHEQLLPPWPRWGAAAEPGGSNDSGSGGGGSSRFAASLAGLSLAYALPIVGLLNGLLTSTAETEQVGGRTRWWGWGWFGECLCG